MPYNDLSGQGAEVPRFEPNTATNKLFDNIEALRSLFINPAGNC
jgi:hypothetical protein